MPSWRGSIPGGQRWQQTLYQKLSVIVCSGVHLLMGFLIATAGQRPVLITFANDKKLEGL